MMPTRGRSQTALSSSGSRGENIVPIPDGLADRLSKIRNQFDEIANDRDALQLRESDGPRRPNNIILRPPTSHMVDEATMFGRDTEVTKVVNLLLSNKENPFFVVSIIGVGGLGKTTIAQLVYEDRRLRQCFDKLSWVCVSEEYDVRRLTKATIESVSQKNCGVSELSPLQEELAKNVKGKQILLVLDDVWNENQSLWETFQIPLREAKLVRLLVTTRNSKVADVMQTMARFRPAYLPENSSWQLFQHYAFGATSYSTVPIHLVEMGIKIIRKCGGLPLAVKSIASLLRHETDEESWREILESDLWESNPSNDIFPALQISYAHLPAHLKPCFLFCSMYPKDYKMKKMNLIEQWISHGYIEPRGKRTVKEVGVEYYGELRERSFIEVLFENEQCKLHDIIHDLARLNSEKEHYSMEISRVADIQEVHIPHELHHLYASVSVKCVNKVLQQNLKGLRTLSLDLHGGGLYYAEHQHCIDNTIFNQTWFEPLRVLELEGGHWDVIPDSIGQLKHLSHLRINCRWLKHLPESIGLLYNLQTFLIHCPIECLPESMGNLANLQYLCIISENFKRLPNSFFLLSNLERLKIDNVVKVPSDSSLPSHFQQMIIHWLKYASPEEIDIYSLGATPKILVALASCPKLRTLKIGGCCVNYNPQRLKNFPAMRRMVGWLRVASLGWLKDMKNLEGELTIVGLVNMSDLVDAELANLRSKCRIERLNLIWQTYDQNQQYITRNFRELIITVIKTADEGKFVMGDDMDFGLLEYLQLHPHLKKLLLQDYPCATLPGWLGDTSYLQAIQEIRLLCCHGLQSLPLHNLHTLKYLQVLACSGIQVLQLEQLPSQLEKLEIKLCDNLKVITGVQNMGMLHILQIESCKALKSIIMDKLQLVEFTLALCNSSYENPRDGPNNTLSLEKLHIWDCPLLCALPSALIPCEPCAVWIHGCGCPDLVIGDISSFDSDL